ncbi:type II toxin-antitoxin system RelE/ParE family toxin [Pseudanabaena sp. UWO310]|uniref:type II toxin-antitoxin system RelE/ParE family toxin n=1 Tax=Pseudanabaena sp. UWO310 TaxID=2480795 RepID=UPI001158D454|nr:type II toxin-antitoxin system RelE/ParE family toxin [Pseudanabaena sp. UWO310]TYQ27121.1 type II toxin-antitoxin system RelE/ParE family toxin [Pseudanabaena sp. UWO310]
MLLEFDPNAQLELEEATSYYDSINRKLGNTFIDAVERTLNRIVQFPEAWTPMIASTRRCHVDGFPYGIVYRTYNERIQVLAVMHLQREPRYWINRIQE